MTSAEEDTTNGIPDKWETYEAGIVKTAAFDEDGDGKPDRRLAYSGGSLVTSRASPTLPGRFTQDRGGQTRAAFPHASRLALKRG